MLAVREYFETCDERGRPAGLVERSVVHARGHWHRAVHVWLLDGAGRVHVQRRPSSKDVCPGCWDLTVGEHLQPGEEYEQAAHRGLAEELGIEGLVLERVGGVRRMRLDLPEAGIRDYELQQTFRARHDGPLRPASGEVAEVRLVPAGELEAALRATPGRFTPWMRQDAADLGLLDPAGE